MKPSEFAEFDPEAWQEDGILIAAPRRIQGWAGTRMAKLGGAFAVGGASALFCSTLTISHRGGAENHPSFYSPHEPTSQSSADTVPIGYWQRLGKIAARWPTLAESDDEVAGPEPII
jgi:hypothetical protein